MPIRVEKKRDIVYLEYPNASRSKYVTKTIFISYTKCIEIFIIEISY